MYNFDLRSPVQCEPCIPSTGAGIGSSNTETLIDQNQKMLKRSK